MCPSAEHLQGQQPWWPQTEASPGSCCARGCRIAGRQPRRRWLLTEAAKRQPPLLLLTVTAQPGLQHHGLGRVHPSHHIPCSWSQPSLGCHLLRALALRCPPVSKAQVARLAQEVLAGELEVLPSLGGHMGPRGGGVQLRLQRLLQSLELPVLGNGPCTPADMSDGTLPS